MKEREYEYKNSKSVFGIKEIGNKKYFYKITNSLSNEINGYNEIRKIYDVPKIISCSENEILYEYVKELENKTIHDYLYNNKHYYINYKKIFKQYSNAINNLIIQDEKLYRNSDFFYNRLNMIESYLNSDLLDKTYVFNNKCYSFKKILEEIYDVINKSKKIKGIPTLGDPTDTNISVNGYFTDFECAGYNSILGEIAILYVSLTSHGSYFYPKYNNNAYLLRTNLLFEYDKYKQKIVFFNSVDGDCMLMPRFKILEKNKKVLLRFLYFYKKHFQYDLDIKKYLKYYICMRLLTPLDITVMDEYDRNVIISLIINIYDSCTDIESLIKIVKNMEVAYA